MKAKVHCFIALFTLLAGFDHAAAQGTTAFTYQGQLHDGGTNANGTYRMIFALYDSPTSTNQAGQVGIAITNSPTLANGLFSVNLDFGTGAFNGSARWLDITVQANGDTNAYTLSPRVQVLPTPYALYAAVAATVTNGAIMTAQLATNAVARTNIASGQVVKSINALTDNVILSGGNNISLFTNGNTVQFAAGIPSIQAFTGSSGGGVFVVPTNVTRIMVEIWGGGGGGGGGLIYDDGMGNTGAWSGGGGGSGGYNLGIFIVTPGSSYPIAVGGGGGPAGHGGTSSFSSLMTATGGAAGGSAIIGSAGGGGAGGASTGGLLGGAVPGGQGGAGDSSGSGGGLGGSVWRGGVNTSGTGGSASGPAAGGTGGGPGRSGVEGNSGAVLVYY